MKKAMIIGLALLAIAEVQAQGLVHTAASPKAKHTTVNLDAVQWTTGFWADRFAVCRDVMVPELWQTYTSKNICYSFQNFRVAAGLDSGRFRGPSFHDGDFYKTIEAVATMYASTKNPELQRWMDEAIAVIAAAQKQDGYIYTKNIIEQRKTGKEKMFDDQLSFEAYNFGHLMTAACVHHRATGKRSLLDVATRAADFLIGFYRQASPEQARNAICPSHYMGLTELYRTTGEKKYLDLVVHLINIRGTVEGTDDNSDRATFRQMNKVVGHAVRANYLFAGVADVYAETGDVSLLNTLHRMWDNVVNTKMYVTGGCGALYDGVSVDGTSYKPDTVQKVHQSYGRDFQLPNFSAHNETCANIGNVLWNWRMFLLTGESQYMDVVELALYNSVLSGVGIEGKDYFYTNPLAAAKDYPYTLRWAGGRIPYISKSNCCPPNTVRTIAQVGNYMYTISDDALYVNMYGANKLNTKLGNGNAIVLEQKTAYPWNGQVSLVVKNAINNSTSFHLRVPGWCNKYRLKLNGKSINAEKNGNGYLTITRTWKASDVITLEMDMPVQLIESNPLVEETRNRVAVKKGPVVYCLESADLTAAGVFDIVLPANAVFKSLPAKIGSGEVMALVTTAKTISSNQWQKTLYRPLQQELKPVNIKLIPYFAWANRGKTDMAVWLPFDR